MTATALTVALADRYRIERELGAGGMATVYLARDLKHERDVAIKVMKADLNATVGADRFLREIQLAARLSHPHILPLFDSGEADGELYYVMPRVEGRSLRDRLNDAKQLPVAEAVRIAAEVAGALDHAARQGVVHRDIKPENILLQDGHALVADFGIGKALSSIEGESVTQAGMSVGTPTYMSPEQAVGEAVDGRSDLYSLGCVLYEMLVGEPPFTGPTAQAVIAKRFVQTPADVTALRDGIPRPVARALQKALARTPIDRFDTAAEFATALAEPETAASVGVGEAPEGSLAVLPFANLSSDPENEFLCDGVTEEILTALSQVPGLRVAGRTSSFSFKGKRVDLRTIGEQLKVRTVLDGSVRRSGKRVRITAQLLDTADGYQRWSDRYDREIEDVFDLQDEIARTIATRLKATLVTGASARQQRATSSIEAYEAFVKGRALLARRGRAIVEGIACMERALALDPQYGPAWAGIAEGHVMLGYYSLITPELARAKAMHAAEEAVRCAPDLAEAHCALGMATLLFEWEQRDRTARAFERGMQLNAGSTQGATWYWHFYVSWSGGRLREGVAGLKGLFAQDPLSSYLAGMLAIDLASDDDPECVEWATRAVALDADAFLSRFSLQIASGAVRDWTRVIAESESLFAIGGRTPVPLINYAQALNRSGREAAAASVYDELRALSNDGERATWNLACLAAELGLTDEAARWGREAVRRRDPTIYAFGPTARILASERLRAHPEYPEWMRVLNLPTSTQLYVHPASGA